MPQLSDTMTEGTVVKWHKDVGEAVKAGEEIADVETDKATMPMEAFDSGTLAWIGAPEGSKVKVGDRLAVIALPGENVEDVRKAAAGAQSASAPAEKRAPEPPATHAEESAPPASQPKPAPALATEAPKKQEHPGEDRRERAKVSPLAKRIAAEKGINIDDILGSGPDGRIVQRDVLDYSRRKAAGKPSTPAAPGAAPAPAPPPIPMGESQKIPLSKMRAAIGLRLQEAKQNIPHFYETAEVDIESLIALRRRLNAHLEKEGTKLSIADFVNKAVASALLSHPMLNAHFDGAEITRFGDVHLGIAVALEEGLIVPVLRNVNRLSLREIRTKSADLFKRARQQRLRREELSGATFTISNLGTYGVSEFAAIINPPEVAILAVAAAEPRPVVRNGQIVVRTMMKVTISADHRVVDGAVAAQFLTTLKEILEEPGMMLV